MLTASPTLWPTFRPFHSLKAHLPPSDTSKFSLIGKCRVQSHHQPSQLLLPTRCFFPQDRVEQSRTMSRHRNSLFLVNPWLAFWFAPTSQPHIRCPRASHKPHRLENTLDRQKPLFPVPTAGELQPFSSCILLLGCSSKSSVFLLAVSKLLLLGGVYVRLLNVIFLTFARANVRRTSYD